LNRKTANSFHSLVIMGQTQDKFGDEIDERGGQRKRERLVV